MKPDQIRLVNTADVEPTIQMHKDVVKRVFQLQNVHCIEPKTMLSLDLGTGYYLC